MTVGFVILSHRPGEQLSRLISVLDREYATPPIVCHHDFGQAQLDTSTFGTNVRFVQPSLPTRWGRFTLVEAVLEGLKLLYRDEGPDWFFLLSAQDFPVMSGRGVVAEVERTGCDAFIDLRPLDPAARSAAEIAGPESPVVSFYSEEWNRAMKRRFYLSPQYWLPTLRLWPRPRVGKVTYRPDREGSHPYGPAFKCFYGDMWFGASRRAAQVLINPTDKHRALQRHFRNRTFSDESYWHTVLANTPGLSLWRDNRRFARWGGNTGPETLNEADLDAIAASNAFFARKFEAGSPVLDRIEERLAAANEPLRGGPETSTAGE
ncbi:MAG TPA: beta-1,6-N-acetylglucosaminyltransferase [Sphingomicrobium sp.]